ncbi:replicative DNA helicase [Candidatus Dependentiae bacterium]|nr:replicative DNA helicase [Candidatus Dependentiae bacterium]
MVDLTSSVIPPHNNEAEQSLIAAILFNPECMPAVRDVLKSDIYFYDNRHRNIYSSILALYENNEPVDAVTLINQLRKDKKLEQSGGPVYISEIIDKVTAYSNAQYYANIIKEKFILRILITKSSTILQECYDDSKPVATIVQEAEQNIFEISEESITAGFKHIGAIVPDILKNIETLYNNKERIPGVPSGYKKLDLITSGFQKSDLIIIAARPSMGKTSLALNIAYNAAHKFKIPAAIFSLEMSSEQLVSRFISLSAKVPQEKLRSGFLDDSDWTRVITAAELLYETPIYIDNTYGIDPVSIMSKIRRLKTESNLGLVIIDYLQMMKMKSGKTENRQQEVSEISRALKGIAREMNVPVIVLSQLSRQLESRTDKRPQLADLRESGAIEQDADLVLFVYRDEKYNPDSEFKGIAEINIGKHRNGPLGKILLTFLDKFMSFENYEDESFDEEY